MSQKFNLSWKPLNFDGLGELRQALAARNPEVSELSLANLFIWRDFDRPQFARLNDWLLLCLNPPNEPPYLLEPLGPPPSPSFLMDLLYQIGRFSRLPESFLSFFPEKEVIIKENRDQFDYLFWREKMAGLQGKRFDGKRNLIRRFQSNWPDYEFTLIDRPWQKEALSFFFNWAGQKGSAESFSPLSLDDQAKALNLAFELWEVLGLMGGALISRGEWKGFIIASKLNERTALIHFHYADLSSPGASQTLLWEACRQLLSSFPLINLEQDLGLPGLRKAKLSYHPCRLVAKYDVYPSKKVTSAVFPFG